MSTSTRLLPEAIILSDISSNKADLDRAIDIITHAFLDTALGHTFIVEIDSTPPPYPSPSIDYARRRRHFVPGITEAAESNALFVHAGENWSAVAIWEPPDFKGKPFVETAVNVGPIRGEWREKIRQAKAKYLALPSPPPSKEEKMTMAKAAAVAAVTASEQNSQLRPFYHLSFLARNPLVPSVPGAISAVVKPILARAVEENVPAWLEATTPYAVGIYEHFGFRLVETVSIGVGRFGIDGWPKEDGEGVKGYFMLFDGHLQGK